MNPLSKIKQFQVADGKIYVLSDDGKLYRYDKKVSTRWREIEFNG
jgi:outer membrane protein assembly factor BamB